MDEITEKVLQRLEALGGQLADTTQQAFEVYTRQAFVEGVFGLSVAFVSLLALIAAAIICYKNIKKANDIGNKQRQHVVNCDKCRDESDIVTTRHFRCNQHANLDDPERWGWIGLACALLGFIAFIFFAVNIGDVVQVINPEYYAIQDLIEQVRSGSN